MIAKAPPLPEHDDEQFAQIHALLDDEDDDVVLRETNMSKEDVKERLGAIQRREIAWDPAFRNRLEKLFLSVDAEIDQELADTRAAIDDQQAVVRNEEKESLPERDAAVEAGLADQRTFIDGLARQEKALAESAEREKRETDDAAGIAEARRKLAQ